MNAEKRKALIYELNAKVNEFVKEKNLFSGGCCFSAFVLAEIFQKFGIKYRTVLFQEYALANVRDFDIAINDDEDCEHVAIEVLVGGKYLIIGDYSKLSKYFEDYGVKHALCRYRGITPQMLKRAYYTNDWNPTYNTANNLPFFNEMNEIADKYMDKPLVSKKAA